MRSSARLVSAFAVAASLLLVLPLAAQFAQYTAPGGPADALESRREALEKAAEEARWKAGPLRLDPAFGLSDVAYVDSGRTGDEGELTATATAGLRGYLPVGSRSTLVLFALPEYVWWQDRTEARRLNQRFGAGLFTYFNRLAVEIRASRLENVGYASNELARRVASRGDTLAADVEIPIGSRISLVGGGSFGKSENDLEDEAAGDLFTQLDRDDRAWRAGLKWYLTSTLSLAGTWGSTESDFADAESDRSNSGDTIGAALAWNRPKLGVSLSGERSTLEAEAGSIFPGFEGTTWSGSVRWSPRDRFGLSLYGQSRLAYSILERQELLLDERQGATVSFGVGWRLRLSLFAERGTLDYGAGETSDSSRVDDLTAYGGRFDVPLGRRFTFSAGARSTTVDSDLPGAGYELTEILATFGLGLSAGGTWY
jgi:hypothetical protein